MRKTWTLLALAAAASLWSAGARAQAFSDAPDEAAGQAPTLSLVRMVSSIPKGKVWAVHVTRYEEGIFGFCRQPPTGVKGIEWTGASGSIRIDPYMKAAVAKELQAVGFKAGDDPDNLFQEHKGASDLVIGGDIKDVSAELCTRTFIRGAGPNRTETYQQNESTGTIKMRVSWQVYSTSRKKVLFAQEVESQFTIDKHEPGNISRLLQGGLEASVHDVISSLAFQQAVKANSTKDTLQAAALSPIAFTAAKSASATKISDAVGSVVLIQAGGGHGSGFLVSSDGYLVTAAHVVGTDKYVKVRWSDGLEGVGEVIRTDKRRDAALLKADPRGRQPLVLHRSAPEPGDTVFAIGAPIDIKLQSTVTRGVVSANRIMDGFSFIQSDVTVDPGNSGGPLLDEKGQVLGFTDKGLRTAEAPTGLNFFVPIDDALRFLSAEPR